jgi:hypothetical protein
MQEYTRPKTELDRANTQNPQNQEPRRAHCFPSREVGEMDVAVVTIAGQLHALGLRDAMNQQLGSVASTKTSTQATADQAWRQPDLTTICPAAGNAAVKPMPTSNE